MRVLLTGASGFIGGQVLEWLLERGHSVLALQRRRALPKAKRLNVLIGDLCRIERHRRAIRDFHPDACLHLAWDHIGDYSFARCRENLDRSLTLVELLRETSCRKFLAAGSCWEYGVSRGPCREDMPTRTLSAFTWAKNALHDYARCAAAETGGVAIWCRVFFAYGHGQREGALIPTLAKAFQRGARPAVRNPRDAQDFIHVSDVAEGFVRALERRVPSGVYNLGGGRSTRVAEVSRLVGERLRGGARIHGRPGRPDPGPGRPDPGPGRNERPGPPVDFWADMRKTRRAFGWAPRVSLREGIADYCHG